MSSFLSTLAIIFIFTFTIYAQTPTPTPLADDDIVKITTSLIQVDVTVTDKKGKLLRDLKAEDFEIYENDKKQKIANFSFVSSKKESEINVSSGDETFEVEPPPPVKELKPSEIRRTIAIVVDDLSLSFESVKFVKRSLRSFVDKQMQPGDLVAIMRASGGLGALQQFSANKQYLYDSIEKIKWKKSRGSGQLSTFKPFSVALGDLDPKQLETDVLTSESDIDGFRNSVFASGALGAIQYVVEGMDKLPGRKSIMLMSDGFQIFSRGSTGFTESTRGLDKLTNLIDSAKEASIAIYTMDTRGVQTLNFTAADDLGSRPIQNKIVNPEDVATTAVTQDKTENLARQRINEFKEAQDGLNYLAKKTGGIFIRNTNDLYGGIKKMLDDQSYYLIAYEPDDQTFDPEKSRFNKLDVKVNRENVDVSYSSGFFGTDGKNLSSSSINLTPDQQLNNALISPFPLDGVSLKLSSLFQGSEENKLFINSFVYIDVSSLKFIDSGNDHKKATFDLLAANFDDNGVPTDQHNKTFTININEDIYQRMLKEGFIYYFTMPIKTAGAYQLRVAILDKETNKIGSTSQIIAVPKLKNKEIALSGLALDNIPYKKWLAGYRSIVNKPSTNENNAEEDLPTLSDTAVRKFKRGTVLTYGLEIYNAKRNKQRKNSQLLLRTRVFHDNKIIYQGKDREIDIRGISKKDAKPFLGAINLGTEIPFGDYVLQIIVTDKIGDKNRQIATQFIQFKIVK